MVSNSSNDSSLFGSGKLLDDLIEYVYSGTDCKLIIAGDTAQLPPVGSVLSPALDPDALREFGFGLDNLLNLNRWYGRVKNREYL